MEILNIIGSVCSIVSLVISLITLNTVTKISNSAKQKNIGKNNINFFDNSNKKE